MITEDYVSFEIAKLLKEKGFDEPCDCYINGIFPNTITKYSDYGIKFKNSDKTNVYSAPTLSVVMKWLREVYNIFISISIWLRREDGKVQYVYEIRNLNDKDFNTIAASSLKEFDSPEKTCETAIKYCLENLI